jgi:hypothetical protein
LNFDLIAHDNYLGSISVDFNQNKKINSGIIIFKIKEKGSSNWYYSNNYIAQQMNILDAYPFGFPPISDSKDKTYIVQITYNNSFPSEVKLSNSNSVITSRYQYPKSLLLSDKKILRGFITAKVQNAISSSKVLFASLFYSLPLWILLILYWSYQSPIVNSYFNQIKKSQWRMLFNLDMGILVSATMIYNIIFHNIIEFIFLICLLFYIFIRKQKSYQIYALSLYTITLGLLLFMINFSNLGNNMAMWGYYFLILGLILNMLELNYNKKDGK